MKHARRCHALVLTGAAVLLTACSSAGSLTGAVFGLASGTASSNPGVGIAVGIGVEAGVDYAIDSVLRHWSQQEQAAIADLIGSMGLGERQPWMIRHAIPYGNAQGEVTVVRAYDTPLTACKEAVFSVDASSDEAAPAPYFTTTVCRNPSGWQWALAEPAVDRWGALQ